jgi:hypothetical protein
MSHIVDVKTIILNLDALADAAAEFGATLHRDVPTYKWYGSSVGDYALPEGFRREDLGKCEHIIRLPGAAYEIGVVRKPGTLHEPVPQYTLLYDFWGIGKGEPLKAKFGDGLINLTRAYTTHTISRAYTRKTGRTPVRTTLPNGTIQLTLSA